MQLSAQKVRYEDLRSLPAASLTGSYVGVGSSFTQPLRILKVTNLTDADLLISFDGIRNKDVVGANSAWIHDYCTNKSDQSGNMEQPVGDRVYVKIEGVAPTNGKSVYVTAIYASTV